MEVRGIASVDSKLSELKSDILGDDLKETFETLKAVQDWTDKHGTEYVELVKTVDNKQEKGDYLEYTLDNERKIITFNNNDIIGAKANTDNTLEGRIEIDGWVSLIHLNKWNVVDIGSPKTIVNINTPSEKDRPTVQVAGTFGKDAHQIAYLDDIDGLNIKQYETIEHAKKTYQVQGDYVEFKGFGDNRKTIELPNHNTISGLDTDGVGHNLVMLSKWNVADFGAKNIDINFNGREITYVQDDFKYITEDSYRPTYNDTEKIAFYTDIREVKEKLKNEIAEANAKISELGLIVDNLSVLNNGTIINKLNELTEKIETIFTRLDAIETSIKPQED